MNLELLNVRKDKINQFNHKGITTIEELIHFFPRKYFDYTTPIFVNQLVDDMNCCIIGKIKEYKQESGIIKIKLEDDNGDMFYTNFFHMDYLLKTLIDGEKYLVAGKVKILYGKIKMFTNPEIFSNNIEKSKQVFVKYSSIKGMSDDFLKKQLNQALVLNEKYDFLEHNLIKKYDLVLRHQAYRYLHQPKTMNHIELAKKRILFDDLFLFHYKLKENAIKENTKCDIKITKFNKADELCKSLPFELTIGQKEVLKNMANKMCLGIRLNTLLDADVGAGKTICIFNLATVLAENGYQSVIVAPTGILASQHYQEAKQLLEPLGLNIVYLTSNLKKSEQKKVIKSIESGEADIIIGTHSVLNPNIQYVDLGGVFIDEQQKFGLDIKSALDNYGAHKVVLSGTPIPRTLFAAAYAETMQLEMIKTMPLGRKEAKIIVEDTNYDVYPEILKELKLGHQGYIVTPLITESEAETMSDVINIEDEYKNAETYFSKLGYKVGLVHGNLKEKQNEEVLEKFKAGEIQLLCATTIIETGISVKNANFMVVRSAERFGRSSLWQISGRAKRSSLEPHIWYLTNNKEKLQEIASCKNGFEVAELDLKNRGGGRLFGIEQSGDNRYLDLIIENPTLNHDIKTEIDEIFQDDFRRKKYYIIDEIEM